MKKLWRLLSCLLLVFTLTACSSREDNIRQPTNFYYCNVEITYNNPSAVIQAEKREGLFFEGSVGKLLEDYLAGPKSEELFSLVPTGTSIISCQAENGEIHIVFSEEFAKLNGIDLSVCCSCILMTVNEYADIQKIFVSAQNAQLDEKKEFVLDMNDIVLVDSV